MKKISFAVVAVLVVGFMFCTDWVAASVTTVGSGPQIGLPGASGGIAAILEGRIISRDNETTLFVIDKVDVPVTTMTGQTLYITANDPQLIGAKVEITYYSQLKVYPSGSSAPLSGSQVRSAIQTAATISYQQSLASGELPAMTPPPSPLKPVTTGITNF